MILIKNGRLNEKFSRPFYMFYYIVYKNLRSLPSSFNITVFLPHNLE